VVLLLAAGEGRRLGAGPKAFLEVAGVSILRRSAEAAAAGALVDRLVAAVPEAMLDDARHILGGLDVTVVAGGLRRQDSARAALEAAGDPDAVAVHDAARALCPSELFDRCLRELDDAEAVVAADAVRDTIKRVRDGVVLETLDRAELRATQTPQAFRTDVYRRAHQAAARDGVEATDDAALVERLDVAVRIVDGPAWNIKITTPADVALAEVLLREGIAG
jgi:2-C-methyl-D-erythritol 4-phosphate cytidylyltransferase